MKIAICSDIHLEFGSLEIINTDQADVLVLSGDICVAKDLLVDVTCYGHSVGTRSQNFHDFFQQVTGQFKDVIYVLGNHEHYHGDFAKSYNTLKENLSYLKNLHILEKECVSIGDVTFIGGTLWTDMNNEDPITLFHTKSMMNDFYCVKNSSREVGRWVNKFKIDDDGKYELDENGDLIVIGKKRVTEVSRFCPEDSVEEHKKMMQYIRTIIEGKFDKKFVVVSHHSPSRQSTHERYKFDTTMNGAYSTDLDLFIEDHPQIKLWTHGHTHDEFDYNIGMTRIVCNPRGYVNHERKSQLEQPYTYKVIDV